MRYFLALSFWEKRSGSFSFRQFAQKEDICLCTLTLPLAYCMRNSKEWGHVRTKTPEQKSMIFH